MTKLRRHVQPVIGTFETRSANPQSREGDITKALPIVQAVVYKRISRHQGLRQVWVVKQQAKDYVRAAMMIVLNGEERSCQDGWTLADLVEDLGLTKKRIAAEVNRDIIPREAYGQQRLQAGDVIEVVNFVGGG